MRKTIVENLTARFQSWDDLVDQIDEPALSETVSVPKHKSLTVHLWCLVGARESYAKALADGEWSGFECSMDRYERDDFAQKLQASAAAVLAAISGVEDWTDERDTLLSALYEHEIMHEGQVIRHLYALEKAAPESWKWA